MQNIKIFREEEFLNKTPNRLESSQFKLLRFEDFFDCATDKLPYRRRDYYKITLSRAKNRLYYADKTYQTKKQSLLFTNPTRPFHGEQLDDSQTGYFCVFKAEFFENFGNLKDYSFFKPDGIPIYELSDTQYAKLEKIFIQIDIETNSDYVHKDDLIRNLIFQILHSTAKMYPAQKITDKTSNAKDRLETLFNDLLERQFPIDNRTETIKLRAASEFATNLSVHVNHLNKVLKTKTGKSTSAIIASRLLQVAKQLLRKTNWNIAEIAYCLSFKEATHFNSFFKKQTGQTPSQYRTV